MRQLAVLPPEDAFQPLHLGVAIAVGLEPEGAGLFDLEFRLLPQVDAIGAVVAPEDTPEFDDDAPKFVYALVGFLGNIVRLFPTIIRRVVVRKIGTVIHRIVSPLAPIRVGASCVSAYALRSFDNETNYQSFFSLDVYSNAIQQLFRQMMLSDKPYAQIERELHIVRSTLCRWRKGLGLSLIHILVEVIHGMWVFG